MEQVGQVVAVNGDKARIMVGRHSACSKCGGCGAVLSGSGQNFVEAQNIVNATVGQTVKVVSDTGQVLMASFVVYIVPIIALLLGIWLGQEFGTATGIFVREEMAGLAFGVIFLLVSYMFVRGYDRRVSTGRMKISVVAILENEDPTPKDERC